MKILVISDSHGKTDSIPLLLECYNRKVHTVIHLGDNVRDLLQFESQYPTMSFIAVAGNCDFTTCAPRERIITLSSKQFLLTHGHNLNVKTSYNRLMYYSLEREVDACLFGHTHIPEVFSHDSVFFMNPGSISEPRGGSRAGYGLITIDNQGIITGELINL